MSFQENRRNFINQFSLELKKLGFNKKRETSFYRKTDLGDIRISLGFEKAIYGFECSLGVGFRIDTLEEITGQYPINPYAKIRSSFSLDVGKLMGNQYKKWLIRTSDEKEVGDIFLAVSEKIGLPKLDVIEDVNGVMSEMIELVKLYGIPFLDKYAYSIESVFRLFTNDYGYLEKSIYLRNLLAKDLITLAFLINDKEMFEKLVEENKPMIREKFSFDIENFENLISYLRGKFQS